jgi:hypothetical protein
MRLALTCLALTLAAPAAAQDWFVHQFGELRAFHGDWLAVCNDEGYGPCRITRAEADPGSGAFFDMRLAVHRGDLDWAVEVMDRGMDEQALTSVTFDIDGAAITLTPNQFRAGEFFSRNVAETIMVTDGALSNEILDRMRAGNRLTVTYTPAGTGDGRAIFPLRGVTAASDAVERQVLVRQE